MPKVNNESESSRKRAKNYTTEEEMLLVDMVEIHKSILANKKSDAVIWKQKEEAWRKIAKEFEATMGVHRHWKALREKYVMLRKKSRLEMAELKSETNRTGGVVSTAIVSDVSAKIASMLDDSAAEFQNCIESDYFFDHENYQYNDEQADNVDDSKMSNIEREENASPEETADWSSWKPPYLREPKSKEIVFVPKRKRYIEEEKMELVLLQQKFYKDENIRSQEKHEQEMLSLKLKNEILSLELAEKKNKKSN